MKNKSIVTIAMLFLSTTIFSQTLTEAIKLTTNEQFESADAAFKLLIQATPNNGEIYFYYGENYFNNENREMARQLYQKGIDMNATHPLCYVGHGKVQWYNGKQTDAKASFYKATTLAGGKNATVLMKIAEAYINADTKNLTDAFALLTQSLKLEPKNPEIFILTGDAYLAQNDATNAANNYEKAAELDTKSVKAILRLGKLWNASRNYNLALDYYKRASLIDSSFAPAYREKAEILFRAGQYKAASQQYKKYLQLNNNCSAMGRYAGFLNQAKLYKESIDAAKEAVACAPNNVYLYRYLAYDQFETGDFAGGLDNSNTFFAKADSSVKIIALDYEYRAKLLSKTGKDSLAIIEYKKLLQLQPDKIECHGDIGALYVKMKKYDEAIKSFKLKIEFGKPGANDYFGIGRAYYFSKDFINADSSFSQIIKAQPELALGYLWRAKTNTQIDSKNEKWLAQPFYEAYISKIKPEDVEKNKKDLIDANTYLGVYYINQKDNCKAKLFFLKVIELDATNANAKKFLESPEAKKCQ